MAVGAATFSHRDRYRADGGDGADPGRYVARVARLGRCCDRYRADGGDGADPGRCVALVQYCATGSASKFLRPQAQHSKAE